MKAQPVPWSFQHRPRQPGHYGLSLRFYTGGKWQTRNVGSRFANATEALNAGNALAEKLGLLQPPPPLRATYIEPGPQGEVITNL